MLFTGTVQTFTAPVDGIYQFELWGSPGGEVVKSTLPGGISTLPAGKGGYTKLYVRIDAQSGLYCFVGGSGAGLVGNSTIGGWNGGGYTYTCPAGPHSASGGGMTHVSYTNNLAIASPNQYTAGAWNPTGTIGVAGGGGGGGIQGNDVPIIGGYAGAGGGQYGGNSYGATGAGPGSQAPQLVHGASQTSGWSRGCGQSSQSSSGGGGGWYGGCAFNRSAVNACAIPGAGGSGYICDAGKQTSYTSNNLCLVGTDASIPGKPNVGTALGVHGYIRILLVERQ